MFLSTTYCVSTGVNDTTDTIEGANFFVRFLIRSSLERKSRYLTMSRIEPNTTEGLIWLSLGIMRSMILAEEMCTFQPLSHLWGRT